MWFIRHTALNRGRRCVDNHNTMSIPDHTAPTPGSSPTPATPSQLVHELANLLDGSLRNVSLVLSDLRHQSDHDGAADDTGGVALTQRLDAANGAMQQMAMLLRRWIHHNRAQPVLYGQRGTLGAAVDQAVHLLEAAAMSRCITITRSVSESARQLPAGPLYPIIANALRNSLEAIGADTPPPADGHRIKLDCRVVADQVVVTIDDTGSGLDPALLDRRGCVGTGRTSKGPGHGVGLGLSRQIAAAIGGTIELTDHPPQGARFVLRCPTERVRAFAEAAPASSPEPTATEQPTPA